MQAQEFCTKYGIDRMGSNSLKWDALEARFGEPDLISMWVADMEFKVPEEVRSALIKRIEHGAFGYSYITDSYYDATINWQKKHHGNTLQKEWFRFGTGVVGALYWMVNAFTKPKDSVMIISPVYYPFHNAVKDNGRNLLLHELVNNNGIYSLDFNQFEKDIKEQQVKLLIHCSPHNPVGKVWTAEELETLFEICKRNNVLVISDEIHQDIIVGNKKQIPAFAVKDGEYMDNLITVTAASKTFNLAGLVHCHIFIADEAIREKYDTYVKTVNKTEVNIMGCIATEAAYTYGEEWLQGLLNVVKENRDYIKSEFKKHLPKAVVTPLEGTYLQWIDMRPYLGTENIKEFIQGKCRIALDYGEWFSPTGHGFIRLNLATEPKYVKQAVGNIIKNI